MSTLSTHVLDTARGCPAGGMPVHLERQKAQGEWESLGLQETNEDGRVQELIGSDGLEQGTYRLKFDTKAYFDKQGTTGFYPYASVVFEISGEDEHYHVPLLVSGWGYSTYRGS